MVPHRPKIAVALSGGVDSAVVAAMMKEQGADVVALTMRLQPHDRPDDAVQVAQALGIEHHIIDLTQLFSDLVMDDFAQTYLRGETPIPCVQCNRHIKFGALVQAARDLGATALATGHYAQRIETPAGAQLHRGVDPVKDQSYFLFALTQPQIDFLRFPLGAMAKEETRQLAQRFALPVAQKKDSQDICFVPCGDYAGVVEKCRPGACKPGDIVDQQGRVLGQHQGIINFTVGQRKGLSLSARQGDHNAPLFVLGLDASRRHVIVGPREALAQSSVTLRDVNWLGDPLPMDHELAVEVRLRSAQAPVAARFSLIPDPLASSPLPWGRLQLSAPAYGVAPGQAGVLSIGTHLLGGGWITRPPA